MSEPPEELTHVAIVGGGRAAVALLDLFAGLPSIHVVGLSDLDEHAPGVARAREQGVPYFPKMAELMGQESVSLVLELTGVASVGAQVQRLLRPGQEVLAARSVRLVSQILEQQGRQQARLQSGVKDGTDKLGQVVQQLSGMTAEMAAEMARIHQEASAVSSGAELMSSNLSAVARTAVQSQQSVGEITGSAEQMTDQVSQLAGSAEQAHQVTAAAVLTVQAAADRVVQLGQSVSEISKVTSMIAEIASQTKMLALNATIEGARAGEAGKGFSVVAKEVKQLATETNRATADIRGRVEAIQEATRGAVAEIESVRKVMAEVSALVTGMAALVREQSSRAQGVAQGIGDTGTTILLIAAGLNESSGAAAEVADKIGSVKERLASFQALSERLGPMSEVVAGASRRLTELAAGSGQDDAG